jgi:hypothetical protein
MDTILQLLFTKITNDNTAVKIRCPLKKENENEHKKDFSIRITPFPDLYTWHDGYGRE